MSIKRKVLGVIAAFVGLGLVIGIAAATGDVETALVGVPYIGDGSLLSAYGWTFADNMTATAMNPVIMGEVASDGAVIYGFDGFEEGVAYAGRPYISPYMY